MDFDVANRTLVMIWGFSVSMGWAVSYAAHSYMTPLSLVAFWAVLMSPPIIVSIKWMTQNDGSSLPAAWMLTAAIGVGFGYAVVEELMHIPEISNYSVFWFFLPAMGFAATTYYFKGMINKLYTGAALANFIVAGTLLFNEDIIAQYYLLAAGIQGLPIIYHAYIYEF